MTMNCMIPPFILQVNQNPSNISNSQRVNPWRPQLYRIVRSSRNRHKRINPLLRVASMIVWTIMRSMWRMMSTMKHSRMSPMHVVSSAKFSAQIRKLNSRIDPLMFQRNNSNQFTHRKRSYRPHRPTSPTRIITIIINVNLREINTIVRVHLHRFACRGSLSASIWLRMNQVLNTSPSSGHLRKPKFPRNWL